MVLMTKLICPIETPNTAGPISFRILHTPGSVRSKRIRGSMLIPARNGSWKPSCSRPPTNTAQARARIGGSKNGASHSANTMNETFSSVGVNAGTEKRLQVFRIAPANEVSEMNRMYGKVMRSSCTVTANLSAFATNPGAVR